MGHSSEDQLQTLIVAAGLELRAADGVQEPSPGARARPAGADLPGRQRVDASVDRPWRELRLANRVALELGEVADDDIAPFRAALGALELPGRAPTLLCRMTVHGGSEASLGLQEAAQAAGGAHRGAGAWPGPTHGSGTLTVEDEGKNPALSVFVSDWDEPAAELRVADPRELPAAWARRFDTVAFNPRSEVRLGCRGRIDRLDPPVLQSMVEALEPQASVPVLTPRRRALEQAAEKAGLSVLELLPIEAAGLRPCARLPGRPRGLDLGHEDLTQVGSSSTFPSSISQ